MRKIGLLVVVAGGLGAATVTFDGLEPGMNLQNYSEQGVSFNMSYGEILANGHHLVARPDFSNGFSFLTMSFEEPQPGHTIYFQLFTAVESPFVIQTYDFTLPNVLADELIVFQSGTMQFTTGNPTALTVIDTANIGFLIDNVNFGTPFRTDIVPEPSAWLVVGIGLLAIGWIVQNRR